MFDNNEILLDFSIPKIYKKKTLDDLKGSYLDPIKQQMWDAYMAGKWIVLAGTNGTGKTSLASAFLNLIKPTGGNFISFNQLSDPIMEIRLGAYQCATVKDYNYSDMLPIIIDDVKPISDIEKTNIDASMNLYRVVTTRLNQGWFTLFTTNQTKEEFFKNFPIAGRKDIESRLKDHLEWINLSFIDLRTIS